MPLLLCREQGRKENIEPVCNRTSTIIKQDGDKISVFMGRCKSWSCPDCSKLRRRALIKEAKDGKPNRFVTLTVNPNWFSSPEERAAQLAKAWRLVVAAYRHRWPTRKIEYLAVFEATEKGEPHLHLVLRSDFISQKWLSGQMRKRMGAPIVDVRQVKGAKDVAKYVTKYISKRAIRFGTCKRYWRSAGYLAVSPRKERQARNAGCIFYVTTRHIGRYCELVLKQRYTVTWTSPETYEFTLHPGRSSPPEFWPEDGYLIRPPIAV